MRCRQGDGWDKGWIGAPSCSHQRPESAASPNNRASVLSGRDMQSRPSNFDISIHSNLMGIEAGVDKGN